MRSLFYKEECEMKELTEMQKMEHAIAAQMRRILPNFEYQEDQTCRFCNSPESILTEEACCTGCSKLVK